MSELLDLSRIESGKLELTKTEFKLEDLVDEMVAEARHTTSRHALLYNSDFTGRINADRDRIGQVISNLLNNAIKYSRNSDCVEVLLTEKDGWALIKVKDHGIGIDSKDHEKIFERFYRVEGKSEQTYPGFGIGLFIANEITQRHDGKIVVESAKDLGSEFTIYLPLTSNNK